MAIADLLRREITLIVQDLKNSAEVKAQVGQIARASVEELIRARRASPVYRRFVDGREGAPEESVKLDGGTISYIFSRLQEAVAFAVGYARARSPVDSGRYRDSWFLIVDGRLYPGNIADIPPGSEIALTNTRPYHRKIDVGGQITSVPPGIVEDTRKEVQKRYPELDVQRVFLTFPGGSSGSQAFPYILKGPAIESGLSYDRKTNSWTRRHKPRPTNRSDRQRGQPLTYPSVVISEVLR